MVNIKPQFTKLWTASAPLTASALLMIADFVATLAGLALDPRVITAMPAWLKPAKFAISTAIYLATIAWLFRYIVIAPRLTRAIGWVVSITLVIEIAIIDLQAARGVTSHFNISTPLDQALFAVMGIAIGVLWLASAAVAILLLRQPFANAAWGWTLRLAMIVTVLGAATGGFMLRTTPEQSKQPGQFNGAHTVGAPDGGPGLPGVGWSREHGDLRIPHFLGLHAIQIVSLLGFTFARRRPALVFAISASYLAAILILIWQALRGQSILAPDPRTLTALGVWLAATAIAVIVATRSAKLV